VTVLVAYNDTHDSRRALEVAILEAELREEPLHVVTVLSHDVGDSPTHAKRDMQLSASLEDGLDQLRRRTAELGIEVTTNLRHAQLGEIGHAIVDEAREVGASLVVIGMRRRSRVGKLLLGSTAQDILLGVACPVLAIKATAGRHD
jgi:nucleotide-binding universal stress UspA family protein